MTERGDNPIGFATKGVTGRDGYIIAEALVLAMKAMGDMPDDRRPKSDERDILTILNTCFPEWEDMFGPG